MTDESPIESALEAEKQAKQAVEEAREEASAIRQQAREKARRIERRAEDRIKSLHSAMDDELESRRKAIERQGAQALRELREVAIDERSINKAIEDVVVQLMSEAAGSKNREPDEH